MRIPPPSPGHNQRVWFSPLLLTVALSPVFLQTSTPLSCKSGDTTLSELSVIVDGEDQVDGFDPAVRSYSISLPPGTDEALVHALSTDPNAQVWIDVLADGARERYLHGGFGGGDMVVPLPPGTSEIEVWVRAPKGASGVYEVAVEIATEFPCTEQGILDAVATGGGPHTFDCDGPTTVVTEGEIIIDNDVILDGAGNLTIDGNNDHRVLSVEPGVTAELVSLTVTGGFLDFNGAQGAGIFNAGTLTIRDSVIASNGVSHLNVNLYGGGIYNVGTLTLNGTAVQGNKSTSGCGIYNAGAAMLVDSTVSQNGSSRVVNRGGGGIKNVGTLTLIGTAVTFNNGGAEAAAIDSFGEMLTLINSIVSENLSAQGAGIHFLDETVTLINSTVSGNGATYHAGTSGIYQFGGGVGTLTLINSTVVASGDAFAMRILIEGQLIATNSLIVAAGSPYGTCQNSATTVSGGGNVESPGNECGLTDPTDLVNVTAAELNLGPLADNGGPTMTHALLPGSVAIDHVPSSMCVDADGEPLTTDQRGVARPQGAACDAGAFEWADCSGTACDDGNECTADYCNPSDGSWCAHTIMPDGSLCGTDGVCEAGACGERSWGTPVVIESSTLQTLDPQVAVDAAGNATAVWGLLDYTVSTTVRASRYTPSQGWGTATTLAYDLAPVVANQLRVSADPAGNVLSVWKRSFAGSGERLGWTRYTPGGGWGTAGSFGDANTELNLGVDSVGNAILVTSGVFATGYEPGTGWGTAVSLSDAVPFMAVSPDVAVAPSGDATAVWYQDDGVGSRKSVWANRYTPHAGWGTQVIVDASETYTTSGVPRVEIDPGGNAIATWLQTDGMAESVWSNRYTPGGGWGTAVLIETNSYPVLGGINQGGPKVGVDSLGNAIAVWRQSDGTAISVWSNRYTPGAGWGTAVLIEDSPLPVVTSPGDRVGPALAVALHGSATVVWTTVTPTSGQMWSNRFE